MAPDCKRKGMVQIASVVSCQPKKGESGVAIMRICSRWQKKRDGNEYAKAENGVAMNML